VNPLVLPLGVLLLCVTSIVALGIGAVPIAVADVWQALWGGGEPQVVSIVRDLRGPRVVLAALVGAGLASSGAALQGTLRNPLAEPYLLGVSGGAAVGAVVALSLGYGTPVLVTVAAFGGAAVATALVALLARVAGGRAEPRLLLMAGVVVGAFSNAVILVALADAPPDRIRGALWWMMGSTADATWAAVGRTALALLLFGGLLVVRARELDVLSLGEEPAVALGADVDASARRVFLVASWLAASTVAAVGLIGFVGLVVPNLARAMGAHRHRAMLLVSAVYGAALLVGADVAARSVRAPIELPLGAVTALVGVPFFLARLRRLA
jgi:iron complex transport system permease protein